MSIVADRPAAWAGVFYPAEPGRLRADITRFMNESNVKKRDETICGVISPHAGYVYSGPVAGHAYAAVRGKTYHRVVVLSPSHHVALRGVSIWPRGSFATPLGDIPIDEEGATLLMERADGFFVDFPAAHEREHAVEVQLPFLQVALGPFHLLPLVLGGHDLSTARNLARILFETFGAEDTLYVASSDLSHYHEYDRAVMIDALLLKTLEELDLECLARAIERGETEACGAGPILTAGAIARDHVAGAAELLGYANSGDTAGPKDQVVGYAAFLFTAGGRS